MMYLLLSILPLVPEVVLDVVYLFVGTPIYSPAVSTLVNIWMLLGRQICLLCINLYYVRKGTISRFKSAICMLGVIVASVCLMLVFHKIQYGVFVGDVPEDVYWFLIIVPSLVLLAGIAIYKIGVAIYKRIRHGDGPSILIK